MKVAILLRLICAASLVVGCASTSTPSEPSESAPHSLVKAFATAAAPSLTDVDTPLTNTYWKLIKLNGEPVEMMRSQRKEAYLQLREEDQEARGFAGCNNFSGTFEANDSQISLTALMTTRKACVDIMPAEVQFLSVLEQATSFMIFDEALTLLNKSGVSTAEFIAVYF
ncbi:META domain-containing protein [Luminiphilus sp. nBUS_16]|uniref:META domain-containing protein n=1 Tax=Luminiphilus sp. nBUS_16 TaxID=3395315 RepID=UPI003EC10F15